MKRHTVHSSQTSETIVLARRLARSLKKGDILCLKGELGSGKTTFVKGVAEGFKVLSEKVSSPTFVLLNIYKGRLPIYHFDLYRLEDEELVRGIGCEEFFYADGVSLIEWSERLKTLRPEEYLLVRLRHQGEDKRKIEFEARGKRYEALLKNAFWAKKK